MNPSSSLGQNENNGQLGSAMTSGTPHLRLLPPHGGEDPAAQSTPEKKTKVPPGLFRPQYACKKCDACMRRKAKKARKGEHCSQPKTQNVWWYRKMIRGVRPPPRSTGCTDLRNAIEVAAKIRDEWEREAVGLPSRERLTLRKGLERFRKFLATQRGSDSYHDTVMDLLDEVLKHSDIRYIDDLDEEAYADWIPDADERKLSAGSRNKRIAVLKRLGEWPKKKGHVEINPFALLVRLDERADRRVRRAMWTHTLEKFLRSVRTRRLNYEREYRVHAGLSLEMLVRFRREGRVRALIYNTISQTGLRRRETTLVRIKDVHFAQGLIWLTATTAKSRREQHVTMPGDLARRLAAYIRTLGDVDSESTLFPSTRTLKKEAKRAPKTAVPTITTFDKDLKAAGIPKRDARGRVIDLHSLRMVYVTHLRLAGTKLEVAKRMARHSDASLTEAIYTDFDLLGNEEREAAAALGELRRRAR